MTQWRPGGRRPEQNEFDALCSLVFNIGRQAFKSSTLLRLLNQGQRYPARSSLGDGSMLAGKCCRG